MLWPLFFGPNRWLTKVRQSRPRSVYGDYSDNNKRFGSNSGATGTLGCIVTDVAKGRYLLGCNHVFANLNVGKIGDELWQPGSSDGGTSTDRVGVLHDVEAIHMGGYPKPHGCGRGKARSKG